MVKAAKLPRQKFSDLELLGRVESLSWLSPAQRKGVDDSMACRDVGHDKMIFEELGKLDPNTHILLSGTAALIHLNGRRDRLVAILSPGIMFRMPLMARGIDHKFRWSALDDCRVAQLSTNRFFDVALGIPSAHYARTAQAAEGRLGYILGRYPSFVGLDLLQRVAMALLELAHEFGVKNTHSVLIRIKITQAQLADLVGASRTKVGQALIELERQKMVIREEGRLAVATGRLEALVRSRAEVAI